MARTSSPPEACLRPSGGSMCMSSVVCSIVKGPSPQSVPIRHDLARSRFLLSSDSALLEFLAVPGVSGVRAKGIGLPVGTPARRRELGGSSVGTRPEPIRDLRRRRRGGGPGGATLRPLRRPLLAFRFRSASITHTKAHGCSQQGKRRTRLRLAWRCRRFVHLPAGGRARVLHPPGVHRGLRRRVGRWRSARGIHRYRRGDGAPRPPPSPTITGRRRAASPGPRRRCSSRRPRTGPRVGRAPRPMARTWGALRPCDG